MMISKCVYSRQKVYCDVLTFFVRVTHHKSVSSVKENIVAKQLPCKLEMAYFKKRRAHVADSDPYLKSKSHACIF